MFSVYSYIVSAI